MSYRDVVRRDLLSVSRARTGPAVVAIVALTTVVAVGLVGLAADLAAVAGVGGLLIVGAILALVFFGSARHITAGVLAFTVAAVLLVQVIGRPEGVATRRPQMQFAVEFVSSGLSLVVPLVGMLASYAALVGERETGSVRFLLGLPNSRDGAFLGKYLSRALVVCLPLVVGLALAGVVVQFTYRNGSVAGMLGLAAVTVPYAMLFVGVGLTASAYADSSNRAVAVVVAVFAVFRAGWPALQSLLLEGVEQPYPRPEWFFWVGRVNPINAYVKLTTLFAEFEYGHPLLEQPGETVSTVATTHWFAALVLLAWTVAAPVAGLLYFRRRDLL